MRTSTTTCWSRDSVACSVSQLLEIAAARTFVERDRGQDVGAQRQLAGFADDPAARIDQLGLAEHRELDRARARLARRQVAGDPRSGVVLDGHAMTDQVVKLRVVRHSGASITWLWCQ